MKQYFVVIIMHLKIFINCFRGMEQHPLSPIGLDFLFQGYPFHFGDQQAKALSQCTRLVCLYGYGILTKGHYRRS